MNLLSTLVGQPTALRVLEQGLASGRVHHAYLFTGPPGVGKERAAFGLAQALVCTERDRTSTPAGAGDRVGLACGDCPACRRAVPHEGNLPSHPDVVVIARGIYEPQTIGRRLAETQDISIDQVRTLVLARAAFSPHEGQAKVFVVRQADELSTSAANALLKTLEEPAPKTHFVLLTTDPDRLMPTLLSRSMRVRFGPLPEAFVVQFLRDRGVESEQAVDMARLAEGSLETAALLASPADADARRAFVDRAFEALRSPTIEAALKLAEEAKKNKEALPAHIASFASAITREAAEHAVVTESRHDRAWLARGRLALLALDQLARNVAPQLVVEAMLARMRSA